MGLIAGRRYMTPETGEVSVAGPGVMPSEDLSVRHASHTV